MSTARCRDLKELKAPDQEDGRHHGNGSSRKRRKLYCQCTQSTCECGVQLRSVEPTRTRQDAGVWVQQSAVAIRQDAGVRSATSRPSPMLIDHPRQWLFHVKSEGVCWSTAIDHIFIFERYILQAFACAYKWNLRTGRAIFISDSSSRRSWNPPRLSYFTGVR